MDDADDYILTANSGNFDAPSFDVQRIETDTGIYDVVTLLEAQSQLCHGHTVEGVEDQFDGLQGRVFFLSSGDVLLEGEWV